MNHNLPLFLFAAALIVISAHNDDGARAASAETSPNMSFFVTSAKSKTGISAGLAGRTVFVRTWLPPWVSAIKPGRPT